MSGGKSETRISVPSRLSDLETLPNESKKKSKRETEEAERRDYFCTICFEAFSDKIKLDEHMKTHRELEVNASSCRMESKPAGVF